jgi:hypothetical protein
MVAKEGDKQGWGNRGNGKRQEKRPAKKTPAQKTGARTAAPVTLLISAGTTPALESLGRSDDFPII